MADNETNAEDAPDETPDITPADIIQQLRLMAPQITADETPDITPADIIAGIKALTDSVSLIDSKIDAMTTAITALAEAGLADDEDADEDETEEDEEERDISDVEALDLTTPVDEA